MKILTIKKSVVLTIALIIFVFIFYKITFSIATRRITDSSKFVNSVTSSRIVARPIISNSVVALPIASRSDIKKWKLYWSDEFNGKRIDNKYWTLQLGGNGWGNNELQYYTDKSQNCYIDNSKLVIKGLVENYQNRNYTSARIITKGKFNFNYGKIDIKAKLPAGKGLLPAIWLLPAEDGYGDRKKNGEIDIVEMLGEDPRVIHGTAFYSLNNEDYFDGKYSGEKDFSKEFHIYSLEWSEHALKWLIDNEVYQTFNLDEKFSKDYNPFTKKFYLVMNIAIGGDWPGNDIDETVFPSTMEIDYVRYYKPQHK